MLTKTGEQLSFLAADLERFVLDNLLEEVNTLVVLIRFDIRRSGRNEMSETSTVLIVHEWRRDALI